MTNCNHIRQLQVARVDHHIMTFAQPVILSLLAIVASSEILGNWQFRDDFVPGDQIHGSQKHGLVFAVKQLNLDAVERILLEVSDPASPTYGAHLSRAAVHNMTSNMEATYAIRDYCQKQGLQVTEETEFGEYITVMGTVFQWNKILHTNFVSVRHAPSGIPVVRSRAMAIPLGLVQHVEHIFNAVELPIRQAPPAQFTPMSEVEDQLTPLTTGEYPCHSVMTLQCWNYYYNQTTNDASGETQVVFGQKPYVVDQTDLGVFAAAYSITAQKWSFPLGGGTGDADCVGYDPNMKGKGYLCIEVR
jgi:tripeptidyl-peptidase-1